MSIDIYPGEPDNETRTQKAHAAMARYAELTHPEGADLLDDQEGIGVVAAELFGDMLHLLASEGMKAGPVLSDAFSTFAEEREDEGEAVAVRDPLRMLQWITVLASRSCAYFDRMVTILDYLESEGWHDASNPYTA